MMLDANSYPEVAFACKELYLALGYCATMSICVTQSISMRKLLCILKCKKCRIIHL